MIKHSLDENNFQHSLVFIVLQRNKLFVTELQV